MACDLDPTVFNQCKDMIRPVKYALDHLDPDPDTNAKNQVEQTRSFVITIGRRIDTCVQKFENKKKKAWIRYLWCFVSKFTSFEGTQLYKVYRKAVRKDKRRLEYKATVRLRKTPKLASETQHKMRKMIRRQKCSLKRFRVMRTMEARG